MPTSYSLYEVNEYIRRVVALNFQEPLWIRCEVSQASHSRGSVYLNVVELEEVTQDIKAQSSAVIWPRSYLFLKNKLGNLLPSLLETGSEIMIKATVDFHERYGLKLVIEDIDPSYTLGQAEMARQKIIERLKADQLLDLNDRVSTPPVIQSIAVISSERAAGYQDFVHQLQDNAYGYDIHLQLYDAAVQGRNVESDVVHAIRSINDDPWHYDAIAIIRGGGSKLDLSGFDNYNIGHAIAMCPLPVIVGIGHEIDTTVTDLVAKHSLKTPTAVADFIIDRNMQYESDIIDMQYQIESLAQQFLRSESSVVDQLQSALQQYSREHVLDAEYQLDTASQQLRLYAEQTVSRSQLFLDNAAQMIKVLDPERTLQRGFSIIRHQKKAIQSIDQLKELSSIEVQMKDGTKKLKLK